MVYMRPVVHKCYSGYFYVLCQVEWPILVFFRVGYMILFIIKIM